MGRRMVLGVLIDRKMMPRMENRTGKLKALPRLMAIVEMLEIGTVGEPLPRMAQHPMGKVDSILGIEKGRALSLVAMTFASRIGPLPRIIISRFWR